MAGFKNIPAAIGRNIMISTAAVSLLAALVFGLTLADYLFPGESASLLTQWIGMDALEFPDHPVWGRIVSAVAGSTFTVATAFKVNLVSMVCGVASAGLLCWLVSWFVFQSIRQEDIVKISGGTSVAAGAAAGLAFVFSTATWQASTHLDYHVFDVAFALAVFALLPVAARAPGKLWHLAVCAIGLAAGAGLAESVIFAPLAPLYLLAIVVICVKGARNYYLAALLFLVFGMTGFLLVSGWAADDFLARAATASTDFKTGGDLLAETGRRYVHEVRQWFTRPGWLFVFLLATLPFISCAFAAVRGLNNERKWSQYLFHVAMTLCAILAVATPLSPAELMQPQDVAPVAVTTLVAAVCGYLIAYWYALARTPLPAVEYDSLAIEIRFGKKLAPVAGGLFALVVLLAFFVNSFSCGRGRGSFADVCANELLGRMGGRTWLVTDGLLDAHLRASAAAAGKELNLICLQRDMDDAYLKEFSAFVKEKGLKVPSADLSMSAQLGVLPFIQDWFAGDPGITEKAAVFGVPDLWYIADRSPVPDCMLFLGSKTQKNPLPGADAKNDFLAFWKRMEPVLHADPGKGSREIPHKTDPVERMRLQLRRHAGFVANNLGVALQDAGRDEDAWEMYELVLNNIDCDNICSLFNEFEMARKGLKTAASRKPEIEKRLKAIVDDPKRRYLLWSLSRYYGYIRSPEVFARMGFMWARSAQTGNAIAQIRRAIDFVPEERQAGLLNLLAATYASGRQAEKSRVIYEKVLAKDSGNHDALMGMVRISLQDGAFSAAKGYLQKALDTSGDKGGSGMEWALMHLMNNDIGSARMAMQKVTDLQPKSLQAWCLLAGVLLQQHDQAKNAAEKAKSLEELENVILPRMEKLAENPRDYFVQITRALVMLRKGDKFLKPARDALVLASSARPDVNIAGDMILDLDIRLDDGESAERHARMILRRNRHDRLANYVMGSVRLKEGDYSAAEAFLRTSVAAEHPLAAAQNDLAETLRRLQRFDEAEGLARAAVKNNPKLYVAWETLGSCLLDQKKNLDEAETCIKKAISILKENASGSDDIRMQIALARVQLARGDTGRARGTLRTLRQKQGELSSYDKRELEKLLKTAKML